MMMEGDMSLITRDDVATPYAKCIVCSKGTRSHVLERAKYAEYVGERVVDQSDEFSGGQDWEEVEEVVKFALAEDAVVMCHGCWVEHQKTFCDLVESNFSKWREAPLEHAHAIRKCVATMDYYQFDDKATIEALSILTKKMKEAIKGD